MGRKGEVNKAVQTWIWEQPKILSHGMKKLKEKYMKCIELQGVYVEK